MGDLALLGIGLYTPSEAARLVNVSGSKISRWLRGHQTNQKQYKSLWNPQVDLGDGQLYLGFRDLMEVRVADAFISRGLSPQKVRRAIEIASDLVGDQRPLSTAHFKTDGRTVFLQVLEENGDTRMIDLFKSQHVFREIIEPSLKNIEFDSDGLPFRWWPRGKQAKILVDPKRAFGQPIDAESSVPAAILAEAGSGSKNIDMAARAWGVTPSAIRRCIEFQSTLFRHAA
jgi:hypothetical protein